LEYGHVGGPLSSCEVRLAYLHDVNIEGIEPSTYGELCIRHTSQPLGYLQENTVDNDGWVHTGDVFKVNLDAGSFVFLERQEFVLKSKSGWAVLPQRLEMVYRQSEFVAQIIVYTEACINGLVAVVVPDQNSVMKNWAGRASDFRSVCRDSELTKFLLKALRELANSKGLKTYELIKELIIEPTPWTTKEFITSNIKIRRNAILKKYQIQLQESVQKLSSFS
jgi:long-subunit acyl-CoA synthetase (AMP-forming)